MSPLDDPEIDLVADRLQELAGPDGSRFGRVIRATFDQLYDGQNTGRYLWEQLHKTERTHFGTLVEMNLAKEFGFEDGDAMDYKIRGVEVDCKYSQKVGGWMIPREARGHLCLLVSADDAAGRFMVALIRASEQVVRSKGNQDLKSGLRAPQWRQEAIWIVEAGMMGSNLLQVLPEEDVKAMMSLRSGQSRVDKLFQLALGQVVGRGVIATVAKQYDYMKRVRYNGGSRSNLRPLGIVIFGHEHNHLLRALGFSPLVKGSVISLRLAVADPSDVFSAEISGERWRVANETDATTEAPILPRSSPLVHNGR